MMGENILDSGSIMGKGPVAGEGAGECEGTEGGQGDWSRENDEEGDLRVPGWWVGA